LLCNTPQFDNKKIRYIFLHNCPSTYGGIEGIGGFRDSGIEGFKIGFYPCLNPSIPEFLNPSIIFFI
jgi:hypothetical protein